MVDILPDEAELIRRWLNPTDVYLGSIDYTDKTKLPLLRTSAMFTFRENGNAASLSLTATGQQAWAELQVTPRPAPKPRTEAESQGLLTRAIAWKEKMLTILHGEPDWPYLSDEGRAAWQEHRYRLDRAQGRPAAMALRIVTIGTP